MSLSKEDYTHANEVLDDLYRQSHKCSGFRRKMPIGTGWACVECGADQPPYAPPVRHVITVQEKLVLDAAIAFVQGDDDDLSDDLYDALAAAVAKIVVTA